MSVPEHATLILQLVSGQRVSLKVGLMMMEEACVFLNKITVRK